MRKLSALVAAIKTVLKHHPERAKGSAQGRSVYTVPCVAYVTIRYREYAALRRKKVVDRF